MKLPIGFLSLWLVTVPPPLVPCDAQSSQMAKQEVCEGPLCEAPVPTLVGDDEVSIITPPQLKLPADLRPGRFLKIECEAACPIGGKIRRDWTVSEGLDVGDGAGNGPILVTTGDDGTYTVGCFVSRVTAEGELLPGVYLEKTFTLGPPPPPEPPKNLKELAGKDAPALAEMLGGQATVIERDADSKLIATLDDYRNSLAKQLDVRGLILSPAVPEITSRLDKAVGSKDAPLTAEVRTALVAALRAIVVELGADVAPVKPDVPTVPPDVPPVDPNTTPVSFDGFHVVFVHESGAKERLAVYNLTAAKTLDAYLDSHCTNGAHGWRVWDQHVALDDAPPYFKELMALPRGSLPAMVVASGKRAAVLPLPASPEEAVAILKQWGGQ